MLGNPKTRGFLAAVCLSGRLCLGRKAEGMRRTGKGRVLKLLAAIILLMLAAGFSPRGLAAGELPGSYADPIATKSLADMTVENAFKPLEERVQTLSETIKKLAERRTITLFVGSATAFVNNRVFTLDTAAVAREGHVFLPVRFLAESLGISIRWDGAAKRVICSGRGITVSLPLNGEEALVNDQTVRLAAPPFESGGRILAPVRFIAESFGLSPEWSTALGRVVLRNY